MLNAVHISRGLPVWVVLLILAGIVLVGIAGIILFAKISKNKKK
jgi:hypothetical protein